MNQHIDPLTTDKAREIGEVVDLDNRIANNPKYNDTARDFARTAHSHWITVLHTDALLEYAIA